MVALLWIVRIYKWWMIAWVIMTWIPGLSGSDFHLLFGIPIIPVLAPLDFLSVGNIGFGPIIPLFILHYIENWLVEQVGEPELVEQETDNKPHPSYAPPE